MQPGSNVVLSRRRFDVDEYHEMARAGILTPDDRVELIDGEIVQMTSIGSRHAACVDILARTFVLALRESAHVRVQNPVRLDRFSEPEPDVALLRSRADSYAGAHPTPADVLLLIEVADASLPFDQRIKVALYAAAGIPEVWIVDLVSDVLEIYRDPRAEGYAREERVVSGPVAVEALPDLELELAAILPGRA